MRVPQQNHLGQSIGLAIVLVLMSVGVIALMLVGSSVF